jgi:calpain-7
VSKDDALRIALAAAELSIQALRLTKDPDVRRNMSADASALLSEAERIKHDDGWDQKKSPSTALDHSPKGLHVSQFLKLKEPISTRLTTRTEEILLLKASKLNGFKFPPWKGEPKDSEFELKDGDRPFLYGDGPFQAWSVC